MVVVRSEEIFRLVLQLLSYTCSNAVSEVTQTPAVKLLIRDQTEWKGKLPDAQVIIWFGVQLEQCSAMKCAEMKAGKWPRPPLYAVSLKL